MVRGGPQGRAAKPQDTGELLRKIRISFSALRAALVDPAFRRLLQAELCSMQLKERWVQWGALAQFERPIWGIA